MILAVAALVLLIVIAAGVTVADAVCSPHWRGVAIERRQSWHERVEADAYR
jgi:hypothetical protein